MNFHVFLFIISCQLPSKSYRIVGSCPLLSLQFGIQYFHSIRLAVTREPILLGCSIYGCEDRKEKAFNASANGIYVEINVKD